MDGIATVPPPADPVALADFEVLEGVDHAPGFALRARPGFSPAPAEQRLLDQMQQTLGAVCTLHKTPAVAERQKYPRDRAVSALLKLARAFAAMPAGAARLAEAARVADECLRQEGRTVEWFARVATAPFIVTAIDADGRPMDPAAKGLIYNVELLTRDVTITADVAALKTSLDGALGVVKVVFAEREARALNSWRYSQDKLAALRLRRHDYVTQLLGIATVGLVNVDPTQAPFALTDLARFKGEFRDREAGIVKNDYLLRLGYWCCLAALAGCAAYFASRAGWLGALGSDLRNFFLLITGAAIGTWLSFSLRREVLTFEDLAVLERDQLDPGTRVVFIAGLVVVAGLLFWSRAITVGIGDFGTFEAMHQHGSWALLAGLLAGIAERALATVVSKRAGDFAGAIGGKTTA